MSRTLTPLLLLLAAQALGALMPPLVADPLGPTRQAFEAGDFRRVVTELSPEAMQRLSNSNQERAYLLLGEAYEKLDRPDLALGVYQVSTKVFPKDINLLTQLGLLLHHAGLEEQARPVFENVLAIHSHNAQAHVGLGEIDASLGLLAQSAGHYAKALETLSAVAGTWRDYGEVLYRKRDFKQAEAAVRKSLELSPSAEALVDLAMIQRAQGEPGDALTTLDSAIQAKPGDGGIRLLRGAWLLEEDRFDDASAAAKEALAANPSEPLALWIRARVALKRGDRRSAEADLALAAQADRRSPFVSKASASLLKELRKGR